MQEVGKKEVEELLGSSITDSMFEEALSYAEHEGGKNMSFKEKLKKVMHDLGINQKQLSGMTGIGKSSISQYLSGKNVPTEERQKSIAVSLGLEADYFCDGESDTDMLAKMASRRKRVSRMLVEDAAKLLGMGTQTVRNGLQQGVFPWGYAIRTGENRWVYFINATRFAEIERVNYHTQ